jgi:RIO-like serine/threonine protein kinase
MANSTQLWYGENVGFGIVKHYDIDLFTYENKSGDYGYVSLDGIKVSEIKSEGAWNQVRKIAESHLLKREQLEQEGWVVA